MLLPIAGYIFLSVGFAIVFYYKSILNFFKFKENSRNNNYTNILNSKMDNSKETEKTSGFGSIWNNNSWFYEEKNYSKFAKDYLSE